MKDIILNKLGLKKKEYFLVTMHREENVDSKKRLNGILEGLEKVYHEFNIHIIFPIHPRTERRLKEFGFAIPYGVKAIEPLGFLEFLQLEANAQLILTDSGGVQEEACILNVPCVTLRDNTERPETIEVGGNLLAGTNSANILREAMEMVHKSRNWANPFGDGMASKKILDILANRM